jgi:hypothetical protein
MIIVWFVSVHVMVLDGILCMIDEDVVINVNLMIDYLFVEQMYLKFVQ